MIPKVMKTVYCYLYPEVWDIMKAVEDSVPLSMYRLTGRTHQIESRLSKAFEEYPLNSTHKDWVNVKVVDLDNHQGVMERITTKYSEMVHPLEEFEWVYPGAGSSPLIFHLLAHLKTKGVKHIITIKGEYKGYGAYASHLGMETWHLTEEEVRQSYNYDRRKVFGTNKDTYWFISNPSALNGNIWDDGFMEMLEGENVVLDLSYAGSTRPHVYDVSNDSIKAVILSQSKPYGVFRFRMGGFLYSREEIPSLYGNKWFKDPLRMLQSLKLVEDLGFHTLYRKYRSTQRAIIFEVNKKHDLNISASDALLLGHIDPLVADKLSPEQMAIIEPYKRGSGFYRFCFTPYFEELI